MRRFATALAVIVTLCCTVCNADVCEAHEALDGNMQQAYACPRLDDEDTKTFCCQQLNNSKHCCSDERWSVYPNQTDVNTQSYGNFIGKIVVLVYGFAVFVLVVVDAISHFILKRKAAEKSD